ncbi:hypothetical protein F4780DRAFT_471277 [Xylariomycetidae sp. FL0641]|nr:hypothetical protein F4780DRAFT_471277 [Xylariomycetidae sp. FL0641]
MQRHSRASSALSALFCTASMLLCRAATLFICHCSLVSAAASCPGHQPSKPSHPALHTNRLVVGSSTPCAQAQRRLTCTAYYTTCTICHVPYARYCSQSIRPIWLLILPPYLKYLT